MNAFSILEKRQYKLAWIIRYMLIYNFEAGQVLEKPAELNSAKKDSYEHFLDYLNRIHFHFLIRNKKRKYLKTIRQGYIY